jgi:hypothetical protein
VWGIFQQDQLQVYTKEKTPQLFTIIQFGYLKAQFLLTGIGLHCIDTWVPRIDKHHLIVIKIIQSVLPEYFRKILTSPTYKVLTEDEYIQNDTYHDCACGHSE